MKKLIKAVGVCFVIAVQLLLLSAGAVAPIAMDNTTDTTFEMNVNFFGYTYTDGRTKDNSSGVYVWVERSQIGWVRVQVQGGNSNNGDWVNCTELKDGTDVEQVYVQDGTNRATFQRQIANRVKRGGYSLARLGFKSQLIINSDISGYWSPDCTSESIPYATNVEP